MLTKKDKFSLSIDYSHQICLKTLQNNKNYLHSKFPLRPPSWIIVNTAHASAGF